jgi:carboxypeptidase Taq
MCEKLENLKALVQEIDDINKSIAVLSWDQQTFMPREGAEARAGQIGTLSKLSHQKSTSDKMGALLDELISGSGNMDKDSDDYCLLKVLKRQYDKQVKVPQRLVEEFARTTAEAQHVWEIARENSDFAKFSPYLKKIVELRQEYSSIFSSFDHVYDALLDDFEPGLKTADVKRIFTALRPRQVELIKAISECKQVDDSFLFLDYDEQKQWDFGTKVIGKFGYDWNRGRQDKVAHPFTTTFGWGDVRITTRIFRNNLGSGLFSTMHEGGHAMYEQGVSKALAGTPLADGASLAVHESQSRLWENLVGRSKDFWIHFYPELQQLFPSRLANVKLDDFYKGINKVEPSLIRVEADEATYNLHIMLRLELEIALIEGTLEVNDLPEIWNLKMHEYLGVTPESDADGVLQDVHWSCGILGYFPTYALGNLVSAQLWQCINRDIPELSELIQKGDFEPLLGWLRKNIHCHGAKFEPQELIKRVTGSEIDPEPYLEYLNSKYSEIYGL